MRGRLIVLCGLPGSGKTTTAKRLVAEQGAIRLGPDEWMGALGFDLYDSAARVRIEALQWDLAQDLLRLGLTVVIEWGTWSRSERDALRDGARAIGAAVELLFLDEPMDVLWARVEARGMEVALGARPLTRVDLEEYAGWIERPDAAEMAAYDGPLAG